jgi:5-(carboxyamino)imidazole ribonucleotide synthase
MKIGVIGGGQLGRMMALAAVPLGVRCRFLDPAPEAPVSGLGEQVVGAYDDAAALERLADGVELVTYEFENVPVAAARRLAARLPVLPPPEALEIAQDRLFEKSLARSLGIPTPPFAAVDDRAALDAAVARIGLPAVLKTRRLGYDGKGQAVLRSAADVDSAWAALGGVPLILEGFVDFQRELSVLAVRGRDGESAFYPVVENHHLAGILRLSLAPAPNLTPELQAEAEGCARALLGKLSYVGVLAIELFESRGHLLFNEMAPRVHNSGHWTIEGAETSQFENHIRAVAGLPLGITAPRGHSAMLNLIGTAPPAEQVLAIPGAHLHLYDKAPRPGRKLGHITLRCDDPAELTQGLGRMPIAR